MKHPRKQWTLLPDFSWRRFRKNRMAWVALWVLAVLAVIALLAPWLANSRPWYVRIDGQKYFPAFSLKKTISVNTAAGLKRIPLDMTDWKQFPVEDILWPPVPYSPGQTDYLNPHYAAPGGAQWFLRQGQTVPMPPRFRHRLGTDNLGKDVLSGLIHGSRISMTIGFLSMGIATILGLLVGTVAGFFGDNRLFLKRGRILFMLAGMIPGWFYGFRAGIQEQILPDFMDATGFYAACGLIIFVLFMFLFSRISRPLDRFRFMGKKTALPVDFICSRLIEIMVSLPLLLLIFTIAAVSKPSLSGVMLIIGFTGWTQIARLTRAEMLRIRELDYIHAAEVLGYTPWRIIRKHALPNAIGPALVSISFGVANAILVESALSFIGIGVPPGLATWGSLISSARENFSAWWVVIFPGLCILVTVLCFNLVGEGIRDALDPRLKE